MKLSKTQLIIIGVAGGLLLIFSAIIFSGIGVRPDREEITIKMWGIDDYTSFDLAKKGFTKEFPGVEISYTQVPEKDYEQTLIDALAAGTGPDIFMLRSDWQKKHGNKIIPAPADLISATRFAELFPQVATQDFVSNGLVYASPLFIDTLALYYNKDIFDRKNIALPPSTWDSFKTVVSRGVTASFGGYAPLVARSGDIMNALLMQANADLSLQNKSFVRFADTPGETAVGIYTSIKAPTSETYSGFSNGTLGMIIDYQSVRSSIKASNPGLNFSVAPLPQINSNSSVVPARYYGLAVSNKSEVQALAWEFISYMTTNISASEGYLTVSGHPPALRGLIQSYSNNAENGVFASQALIARSWNMPAYETVMPILNTLIQSVVGGKNVQNSLMEAENAINNLVK
jgi:multiple sugar transport system substrate-binding protein